MATGRRRQPWRAVVVLVRLEIDGDLQRSEVFRSQDDVLTAGETSKAAMIEKGWKPTP